MASSKKFAFILLLIVVHQHEYCAKSETLLGRLTTISKSLGTASSIVKYGLEIYDTVYKMLEPKTIKESESDQKLESGMEQRLTDKIKDVSKKLDFLKVNMESMKDEIIDKITNDLPDQINLKQNLADLYLRINQIENLYENFISYVQSPEDYAESTLIDFAQHATSHDLNELPNVLKIIHQILAQKDPNAGESILTILSRSTQSPKQMCQRQQSLQQMLYNLYNTIAITDIKGYTMIQSSYSILHLYNYGNYTGERELAERQLVNRISNTLQAVKKAMASASRTVWKCDTYGYQEDITYTKLNNVFQKYIINEADINSDGTCTKTCGDYERTKVYDCYNKKICAQQRPCNGELWDCEYRIGTDMWICPSDVNSTRRYEYIEYGNSQRYGLKGSCKTPSTEVSSWTRGTVQCTYCTCTCDDLNYSNSDRYVNLRKVVAKRSDNRVVTGVRFRKVNHMLHIQIQEGKLLPGAVIDENSVRWKPIFKYKWNEPMPNSNEESLPREYFDYYVLKWKTNKWFDRDDPEQYARTAINLDDLDFPDQTVFGHRVVTGVKFSLNTVEDSGVHLNLEVQMTPFNFTTGELDNPNSRWYSTFRRPKGNRKLVLKTDMTEVNIDNLDVPTNSGAPGAPTSQTNQFVRFTTSSLETDAGQSTIPFIDLQSVVTYPHVPLSGVGIFHKSSPGSAGFLSLKLFTYNYEPHLQVETE